MKSASKNSTARPTPREQAECLYTFLEDHRSLDFLTNAVMRAISQMESKIPTDLAWSFDTRPEPDQAQSAEHDINYLTELLTKAGPLFSLSLTDEAGFNIVEVLSNGEVPEVVKVKIGEAIVELSDQIHYSPKLIATVFRVSNELAQAEKNHEAYRVELEREISALSN